jgi:hypothetical protein
MIAVALEGVLSDTSHRNDLRNESFEDYQAAISGDTPNKKLIEFLKHFPNEIVVYSTTPDNLRPAVLEWCLENDLNVEKVLLKKKSDYRTDQEIKIEMIKSLDSECKYVIENSIKVAELLRAEDYLVLQV